MQVPCCLMNILETRVANTRGRGQGQLVGEVQEIGDEFFPSSKCIFLCYLTIQYLGHIHIRRISAIPATTHCICHLVFNPNRSTFLVVKLLNLCVCMQKQYGAPRALRTLVGLFHSIFLEFCWLVETKLLTHYLIMLLQNSYAHNLVHGPHNRNCGGSMFHFMNI